MNFLVVNTQTTFKEEEWNDPKWFSANLCPNVCQIKGRLNALTCIFDDWAKKLSVIKLLSFASPKQTTQQKVRPKVIITVKI